MTDAERQQRNDAARARGHQACPVCGDSRAWKAFHETPYFAGPMTLGETSFLGELSIAALCEPCWLAMPLEQRWPHYLAVLDAHRDGIKAVAMRPTPGGLVPDPDDQARHDREMADHAAKVAALRQAVTEGK